MTKNLVIVESPAKAKTLEKFLGEDYKVMSSYGHIRDLKKKDFSVNLDDFTPVYVIPEDKEDVVAKLKKAAKGAENVWLASDEDREGQAISWHLAHVLGLDIDKTKRIVFHEITKNAILEAIKHPRTIDKNLVNAQQARRVLDRIVGFKLSPVLWKKLKPQLSAGRVQSVAVRLIVEREREIQNFKPEASFKVTAEFVSASGGKEQTLLKAEYEQRFATEKEAQAFLEKCQGCQFTSQEYKEFLKENHVRQSMDGKSCWADNIRIERWFRSFKYEEAYLTEWHNIKEARAANSNYIHNYNFERCHSAIGNVTPASVYYPAMLYEAAREAA